MAGAGEIKVAVRTGPPPIDQKEIERRFLYHPPNDATRALHEGVRKSMLDFAAEITDIPGESREKSLAMTALEEASFWLHAHIARNIGREETSG